MLNIYLIIFIFIKKIISELEGIYTIKNVLSNLYLSTKNNKLIISNIKSHFRLILIKSNIYLIETRFKKKKIGIDDKNSIKLYNREINAKYNNFKIYWNLIEINKNEFLVQNRFNNYFLEVKNNRIVLTERTFNFINNNTKSLASIKDYSFIFLNIFREKKPTNNYLNNIRNEPIDAIIKYIDLTDKNLKRKNIIQIYKDENNEELKYS